MTAEETLARPQLMPGARLHYDKVRERHVLLFPEGALALNQPAVDVLELCDGERSIDEIAQVLSERYSGADVREDVGRLVTSIAERGLVIDAHS